MKKIILNKKIKFISTIFLFAIIISIVIFLCLTGLKQEEIALSTYKMDLIYDNDKKTLSGSEEITFINNYDNMFTYLYLHLYPNAFREGASAMVVSSAEENNAYPEGISYGDIEVQGVASEGENLTFSVEGVDKNILKVELLREVYPDESITFTIDFTTTLANINHRLGYGANTINLGNFYPIICMYESGKGFKTDLYHSNGDPFYSECANYEVTINYPSNYTLASSGELINSSTEDGTTTSCMTGTKIRDFCMVLSNNFSLASKQVGNTTIQYYGYNGDTNLDTCLQICEDALLTFNNLFGEYPYSQLSVVKANFIHGGMEYPNLVLISDDVSNDDLAYVIVHEIAHQWWYGVVGNDENNHAWLDEGLAEYSTILFFENNTSYGEDSKSMIENSLQSYKTFVRIFTSVTGSVDTSMDRPLSNFNTEPEYVQCTYTKGLLLFDAIRDSVGDRKFFKALKEYYQEFSFKNVTPATFIASFNHSTGYDLESFIMSWLNGEVVIE